MRFLLMLLATASVAVAQTNQVAEADEAVRVRVTGDRVSLRAKPSLEGELLDRAIRGEEMVFFGQTNGWVAVQAPDSLNFWVAAEYIQNGIVMPKKLNVRSGPSINYNEVAILERDDTVSVRGEFNDWLKIAPPLGSRVWISEDYVEFVEPPKPEPMVVAEEPQSVPEPVAEQNPEPQEELSPLMLVLDEAKPQGKVDRIPGILRRANPGLYKLVLIAGEIEEPICLVRGRESQLEKLLNRSLLIEGKVYWVKDVNLPVIQPDKINLDPIIKD
ncbi:SH3 domain-containing protein [Pontiella sp.]|uniref:SH3 domain-containing protein n=1 Tax=Pontiella sp. TaxID=2837462 RepID=UPI00356B22CF